MGRACWVRMCLVLATAWALTLLPSHASGGTLQVEQKTTSGITGQVVDGKTKAPLPGARVEISYRNLTANTDAKGNFVFRNIEVEGAYIKVDVAIIAPNYGRWALRNAPVYAKGNFLQVYAELGKDPYTNHLVPREERAGKPKLPRSGRGPTEARIAQAQCTGHASDEVPPQWIRVLKTKNIANPNVLTYSFNFYVKHVLGLEWGPSWHHESLRAGAQAVKNYG